MNNEMMGWDKIDLDKVIDPNITIEELHSKSIKKIFDYTMSLMSFDEYWDWRCEEAKKELHHKIDGYYSHINILEYIGILINDLHNSCGIPKDVLGYPVHSGGVRQINKFINTPPQA